MKVIVKVQDVVSLARRFESQPAEAMRDLVGYFQNGVSEVIEQLMEAEVGLFLGKDSQRGNKRNGFRTRSYGIKGIGIIEIKVPRDRNGEYSSQIIPQGRRYDVALEKDLALLHLAGLSTRTLSLLSKRLLGMQFSPQEVTNALHTIVPAAKSFLERPLGSRKFQYLFIDGTNFHVRRTTVEREPTLVVIGVDETNRKSVLAMVQGDKDSRAAWEMVFAQLKERGLDASAVKLGIMDGLPGLEAAFREAFLNARTARCWVHKARNIFPLVPRRYQGDFKICWDAIAYAENKSAALTAFASLKARWSSSCADAVERLGRDIDSLLNHYDFPKDHWDALRTTNPIERVNKEFKRRSKSMETIGPDGLKALLAFTALRLEFGWTLVPITSRWVHNLKHQREKENGFDAVTNGLLN